MPVKDFFVVAVIDAEALSVKIDDEDSASVIAITVAVDKYEPPDGTAVNVAAIVRDEIGEKLDETETDEEAEAKGVGDISDETERNPVVV